MYPFTVLYSQYKLTCHWQNVNSCFQVAYILREELNSHDSISFEMLCGFNRTLSKDEQTKNQFYYFLLQD